jgi:hypothetical protein
MTNVRSWQFWVIIALALVTMACAGRSERRQEAREARAERAEQKRAERAERNEQKKAAREGRTAEAPDSPSPAQTGAPAAAFTPISTAPTAAAASADSKVVFLRATNFGGAIAASVFDVTDAGEPKFIGIINRGNKLAYPVKPGLYTFMVVSEAADFMQATVAGGRTYYALVTPRMGVWKARFSFKPVRGDELDGNQFAAWDRGTRLVANTPKTLAWAKDNAADIADKRDRYLPEWSSKPASDRAAQTLNADDGR